MGEGKVNPILWAIVTIITAVLVCIGTVIGAILGGPIVGKLLDDSESTKTVQSVPMTPPSTPVIVPSDSLPIQSTGPFREHQVASVGTGPFVQVTYSDGTASFSQNELNTNHQRIQIIRPESNPDGCGISVYDTDKVWFSSSANTIFTGNGQEIGRLSIETGRHGYIANWSVQVGDKLCAVGFSPSGYHIIIGPDMYYHYDSYCYRGYC